MIDPRYNDPGTFYWLKVPITHEFRAELKQKHVSKHGAISHTGIKWDCSAHFVENVPEFTQLGIIMQRVESYDLVNDKPWYSIACNVEKPLDDELKMLVLLKYDLNYEGCHRITSW